MVHNESSWAHVKTKKYGVKTFNCSHCDKKFGLSLWQEFLKFKDMKTQKSMVSKLLVALLNSLSHTWQLKKVQNALFQVSYFMLYRMVFPKILCNRPANQYHRQISLQGFIHATSEKNHFYQLTRVFKTNSIWSRRSAFEQIMVSLLAGPAKNV